MSGNLFPTTVVGSYPQPDRLIDRPLLAAAQKPIQESKIPLSRYQAAFDADKETT